MVDCFWVTRCILNGLAVGLCWELGLLGDNLVVFLTCVAGIYVWVIIVTVLGLYYSWGLYLLVCLGFLV